MLLNQSVELDLVGHPGASIPQLQAAVDLLLLHLEAEATRETPPRETRVQMQAANLAEEVATAPASKPSSSEATGTAAGTSNIWLTSWARSFPVNPDGTLSPSAAQVISGWLNSRVIPGDVRAVEIGLTLTFRGSTSPDGSRSPSTEAPSREASGSAGSPETAGIEAAAARRTDD